VLAEQGAQFLDDFAGAQIVLADVGQDRFQFLFGRGALRQSETNCIGLPLQPPCIKNALVSIV